MLLSFENYMLEDSTWARRQEILIAYPSIFELICLLPLSKSGISLDMAPLSSKNSLI
jgi:hypothetical protein